MVIPTMTRNGTGPNVEQLRKTDSNSIIRIVTRYVICSRRWFFDRNQVFLVYWSFVFVLSVGEKNERRISSTDHQKPNKRTPKAKQPEKGNSFSNTGIYKERGRRRAFHFHFLPTSDRSTTDSYSTHTTCDRTRRRLGCLSSLSLLLIFILFFHLAPRGTAEKQTGQCPVSSSPVNKPSNYNTTTALAMCSPPPDQQTPDTHSKCAV